jgi:hypothetical protein
MRYAVTVMTALIVTASMVCAEDTERRERPERPAGGEGSEMRPRMERGQGERGGQRGGERGGGERGGGRDRGEMMERMLSNPDIQEKLGLSAEQVEEIKEELHDMKLELIELKAKMDKIGLEQAKEMTSEEPNKKTVIKLARKAGGLRTEIAVLNLERMFLFRENVPAEKMAAIRGQMRERMQRRGKGGADSEGGNSGRRAKGEEGRRRRQASEEDAD